MGFVEDATFFLLTLCLFGAILISPKEQNRGENYLHVYPQGQAATEVPIRAWGQPFDMARVGAYTLKAQEMGRNAEEGTAPDFNIAWMD